MAHGFTTRPLQEGLGFGREVIGLTPAHIEREDAREALRRYWVEDGLVVFRGSEVTPDFQITLSQLFGELEIHPIPELRSKERPELIKLVSDQAKEGLFAVDGVESVAFLPWHFDLAFMDSINRGGVLTANTITSWGGETGFIDRAQAYDQLPDELKTEIEGLEVVGQLHPNPGISPYGTKRQVRTLRVGEFEKAVRPRVDQDYPQVVHPAVFTHPDTGRKTLNISPFNAQYILGRDDPAGHALLRRLVDHLESCPTYYHSWQPSEMLLWDNWRMLHSVTGAPPDELRVMHRTTIKGDYGVGRKLREAAVT